MLPLTPPPRVGRVPGPVKRHRLAPILLLAILLRAAPLYGSSGSDLPQFLAFAETMVFPCVYASGYPSGMDWPYPWPYPYGPLFLLLLKVVHGLVCPCLLQYGQGPGGYTVIVDPLWAAAVKAVYAAFDVWIVVLLYRLRWWAGLAYAVHPMALYVSSIYGMLDPIPVALLLAGLIALEEGRSIAGGVLAGLSIAFKATVVPGGLAALLALPGGLPWALGVAGAGYGVSFLACPGDTGFFHAIAGLIGTPGLPRPMVYSFNGLSSLAIYLVDRGHAWAEGIPRLWPLAAAPLYLAALLQARWTRRPLLAGYLGMAAFIAAYWRVNPQYTIGVVALGLASLGLQCRVQRLGTLLAVLAAGAWAIAYPLDFWARVHMPREYPTARLLDAISLGVGSAEFYLAISLVFTLGLYLVVLGGLACRRRTS